MPASASQCRTLLGMFARHWEPGKVKTRLAANFGESHAATFHALCVTALAERFAAAAERRVLVFSPPQAEQAFRCVAKGRWELRPLAEGNFAGQMQDFFSTGLAQAERVVVIGCDCPDLGMASVAQAFEALQTHDVVIGPASDGSCCLVGAGRAVPTVLEGIAWNAPQIWPQVVAGLRDSGVRWEELPPSQTADDEAGLNLLQASAKRNSHADPTLRVLEAQIFTLLRNCRLRQSRAG